MKRKSQGATQVSNCRRPLWARGAGLIVPAAVSLIALAGVSTGPALELGDRELALKAAEQRVARAEGERGRNADFKRTSADEVALAAIEELRALIPGDCSPVVAHGLVRTAAGLVGLSVDTLQVGADVDLGLDGPRDRIAGLQVNVGGSAPLKQLFALISTLRGLGFPCAVASATLLRADAGSERFEYRVELWLLHLAPLIPEEQVVQETPEQQETP